MVVHFYTCTQSDRSSYRDGTLPLEQDIYVLESNQSKTKKLITLLKYFQKNTFECCPGLFSFYKIVLEMIEWIRILCTHDYVIKDN